MILPQLQAFCAFVVLFGNNSSPIRIGCFMLFEIPTWCDFLMIYCFLCNLVIEGNNSLPFSIVGCGASSLMSPPFGRCYSFSQWLLLWDKPCYETPNSAESLCSISFFLEQQSLFNTFHAFLAYQSLMRFRIWFERDSIMKY